MNFMPSSHDFILHAHPHAFDIYITISLILQTLPMFDVRRLLVFILESYLDHHLDGKCHIYDSLYLLIHYIYGEYLFILNPSRI